MFFLFRKLKQLADIWLLQSDSNIKRPKRAEVNFLPNFPLGEDGTSLERLRLQIVDEVTRSDKNLPLIEKLMQTTFALRRNEIINDELPVGEILERWPALKMESQVKILYLLPLYNYFVCLCH